MKRKNRIQNAAACFLAVLLALPVGVYADTGGNLDDPNYVPETNESAPNAVTNEYGDTYYEGDYNDYDHEEPAERTITLLVPNELDGRAWTASGGGSETEGVVSSDKVVFTIPYADEYSIYVDTAGIDMPEDVLTTNIPGATLNDEGDVKVTVNMGPEWAGAVFSAESELSTYSVAFSVDDNGICTVSADTDKDLIIYINYNGDEVSPEYVEGEDPSDTEESADSEGSVEFIGEASSDETLDAHYEAIGGEVIRDDDGEIVEIIEPDIVEEEQTEEAEEEEEDTDSGMTVILIIVVVLFVLIAIAVVIYYIIRNRDRQKYKADDSVYDDDDDDEDSE